MSVISSFMRAAWRAKNETPLAAVIFAASGYMTELTADQKPLKAASFNGFWSALVCEKGDTQGGKPGSVFVHLGLAKWTAKRPETP